MIGVGRVFLVVVVSVIQLTSAHGQSSVSYLKCFEKFEYGGGRQNWDVSVDKNGVAYFANTDGLLYNVYSEWGMTKMPGSGLLRTVVAANDTIWAGGNEFGYFIKEQGEYEFVSAGSTSDQIWNILSYDHKMVFQSETELFFYDKQDQTTKVLSFDERIWSIVVWRGDLWVVLRNGRIGVLEDGRFERVKELAPLINKEVRKMFVRNDTLFLITFEAGVFTYDANDLSPVALPMELRGKSLFTGNNYDENSYCIGSITDGYFRIDDQGNIIEKVNSQTGLIDNTILSMEMDALGNVWLGLDYGIAKVEVQSPFRPLFSGAATYDITDFRQATYLATNKGLFVSTNDTYQLVENSGGQVWKIKSLDEELFICHNRGLFNYINGSFNNLVNYSGFVDLAQFAGTNTYVFSTYHGLIHVAREGGEFDSKANLEIWGQPELFYDGENKCIWAEVRDGTVHKIVRLSDGSLSTSIQSEVMRVFKTPIGVFLHNGDKILKLKNGQIVSVDHPILEKLTGEIHALDVSEDGTKVVYLQNQKLHLDVLLPDGKIHSYADLLTTLGKDIIQDNAHLNLHGSKLRVATDRGVISFDFDFGSNFQKYSDPVVSSVGIVGAAETRFYYPFPEEILLASDERNLMFRFSVNKSHYDLAEYRYSVSGQSWSEWSTAESVLLPQIEGGKHTLLLQCRINGGEVKETTLYFKIEKYWYETKWILLPIVLIILLWIFGVIFIMSRISKRKLHRQSMDHHEKDAQKTLALKNEQLLQYVEIISHKNEFLNRVKSGLEKMRNSESQRWANLIDNEVNNEKKEFLFHKLFSEVHQDFIARITHEYPALTSNDIRILTFIRVNLENKEISSLMNISPRSLDTTRYRLRKKLNLDHEVDLNQFVRDF